MAHFTHINDHSALNVATNETHWVTTLPVRYIHLRNNELFASHGDAVMLFTPVQPLPDLRDSTTDEPEQLRRLVLERRVLETGHPYLVVVAIQAAADSMEYVDCITANQTP